MHQNIFSCHLNRCLGERQSFAARQRERLASSFESVEAARKRRNCEIEEERSGKRQKKNHSGNFDTMAWDKEALKKEVESKKDGEKINWSEVARRYHVTNKRGEIARNGGEIVQEWLVNQGVNIHRFNPKELPNKLRVRRKKKIGQGGEISIPVPETNNELKEKLKMKITSGEYTVGKLIVQGR